MKSLAALTNQIESETEEIDSSDAKITKIQPLTRFKHLKVLILSDNKIMKMENLNMHKYLTILHLQSNLIKIIENTDQLQQLQELNLAHNQIHAISQSFHRNGIQTLNISHNCLHLEQFVKLLPLEPTLVNLALINNPLIQEIDYQLYVRMLLKNLSTIDDQQLEPLQLNIQSSEVAFLRKALNDTILEKSQVVDYAHKIKSELDKQTNQAEQFMFYIDALKDQNKNIQEKLVEIDQEIEKLSQQLKSTLLNNQQSKIEGLIDQVNTHQKYNIKLAKKIKSLELEPITEKQEAQKRAWMQEWQEKEQTINDLVSQIDTAKDLINIIDNQQIKQELFHELESQSEETRQLLLQIQQYNEHVLKYTSKWQENEQLIKKYQAKINTNQNSLQSLISQVLYGHNRSVNLDELQELTFKYKNGLLPFVSDLLKLLFGDHDIEINQITKLKNDLKNKPLMEFIIEVNSSKNKHKKKADKFIQEKQNFINEFQKQTKALAQQWQNLQREKDKLADQLNQKRQLLVQQLEQRLTIEEKKLDKKLKEKREKIVQGEQQHARRVSMYNKQILAYQEKLSQMKNQITTLESDFQSKYNQLEEFERHFEEIKLENRHLGIYKIDIQNMKLEIEQREKQIERNNQVLTDLKLEEVLLKDRIQNLQRQTKDRLNEMLEIDQKYKQITDKLTKIILELNQTQSVLEEKQELLKELAEDELNYEKSIDRAKINYSTLAEKLTNLKQMEISKKERIKQFEIEFQNKEIRIREKQKLLNDLNDKKQRILDEISSYQLKLAQTKASLDSLGSLNNSINKLNLHHRQLKEAVNKTQIVKVTRQKEIALLEDQIIELRSEQANLIERLQSLKKD